MNETKFQLSEKCVVPEEWKRYRLVGLWVRPAKMFF